jgi:hypothetical protein
LKGSDKMGMDCTANSKLVEVYDGYGLDATDEISAFTFSHYLNDYWGTYQAIIDNCDKVYTEKYDKATFDTYEYSRDSIKKLIELDRQNNYGKDFTRFLDDLINSEYDIFYLKIF